jgi:sulfur-oxidizing protein SoxY
MMRRRQALVATAAVVALRPARATPDSLRAAIAAFTGGVPAPDIREGRVRIDISTLVENGNAVPVSVSVDDAPPGSVRRLALFTERNPQPEVAVFHFSPRSGRAKVDTRIRLATSQRVVAVAKMNDGSCWQHQVDVIVTLAACVES